MSTAPLTASAEPQVREEQASDRLRITAAVAISLFLGVAGLFSISSTCSALWVMWITDPLKSIGALIPIVSVILILRVWRSLRWTLQGTWWGLAVLAATIAVVHVRDQAVIEFVLSPAWTIVLPPLSLVAVAYTAGFVLLFGGVRLLRAAWFPVALMWFVNPVPHFFNRYIDLPLQHASAVVARSFAHALGQALNPGQLSLMFTPKFGMFIAPGCNGIRGAVTMGFIALIAGYLYRLRVRQWALLTLSAVLLGYVFNFVRLCGLVFYYVIALRLPWLQDHAAMADYILGACLFFGATLLLFAALRRWSPSRDLRLPSLAEPESASRAEFLRDIARLALCCVPAADRSRKRELRASNAAPDRSILCIRARDGRLPAASGNIQAEARVERIPHDRPGCLSLGGVHASAAEVRLWQSAYRRRLARMTRSSVMSRVEKAGYGMVR